MARGQADDAGRQHDADDRGQQLLSAGTGAIADLLLQGQRRLVLRLTAQGLVDQRFRGRQVPQMQLLAGLLHHGLHRAARLRLPDERKRRRVIRAVVRDLLGEQGDRDPVLPQVQGLSRLLQGLRLGQGLQAAQGGDGLGVFRLQAQHLLGPVADAFRLPLLLGLLEPRERLLQFHPGRLPLRLVQQLRLEGGGQSAIVHQPHVAPGQREGLQAAQPPHVGQGRSGLREAVQRQLRVACGEDVASGGADGDVPRAVRP